MYNQKGFSLIEMVVVAAIIAVISAIAIPAYLNLKPTMRVNGAARQIMADLMWARMKAVSENNNYAISFGTATNTYRIYDDNDNDFKDVGIETGELVKTVNIAGDYEGVGYGFVAGVTKPTGGTLNSGDDPVTFTSSEAAGNVRWFNFEPSGRANKSGGIYIIPDEDELAGTNGRLDRMRAITVINTTGRVRIWNYTGTEWK